MLGSPFLTPLASAQPGQALEISPPLLELKADPGQRLDAKVKIRNISTGPLVVNAQLNDFVAAGEDGQPKILLKDEEQSPYSVKSWLSTLPRLTLKASETRTISLTVSVPSNASPGGHYGVIRFTGLPPELEGSGVSLSASIGTLILVNVSGNITQQAKFAEFTTTQNNKKSSLFQSGPITFVERINNTGNTHIKPKGNVRVTNMFGKEVASFQVNEKGGNVLPQSIRKFEQTFSKSRLFGRYTAQADLVYGSDNRILSKTYSFWVIPYKLVFIVLVVLGLLVFGGRLGLKRYNRHIIKKAKRRSK